MNYHSEFDNIELQAWIEAETIRIKWLWRVWYGITAALYGVLFYLVLYVPHMRTPQLDERKAQSVACRQVHRELAEDSRNELVNRLVVYLRDRTIRFKIAPILEGHLPWTPEAQEAMFGEFVRPCWENLHRMRDFVDSMYPMSLQDFPQSVFLPRRLDLAVAFVRIRKACCTKARVGDNWACPTEEPWWFWHEFPLESAEVDSRRRWEYIAGETYLYMRDHFIPEVLGRPFAKCPPLYKLATEGFLDEIIMSLLQPRRMKGFIVPRIRVGGFNLPGNQDVNEFWNPRWFEMEE